MPNIRVGYGSDFVVKDQKVGIGSDNPQATLDVAGDIRGAFNLSGVTTLTSFSGFKVQKQNVYKPSTIGFGTIGVGTQVSYYETETDYTEIGSVEKDLNYTTLSEDLIIDSGQIVNVNHTEMVGVTTISEQDPHTHQSYLSIGSLENVSVQNHFSVPCGDTNSRQEDPIEGTVRFNDDLNTLEFYNGVEWRQFTYNQGQSGRGVFAGGWIPSGQIDSMDYINIHTLGNAINFGSLLSTSRMNAGCSSSTRGLFGCSYPSPLDQIEYITIASEGDSIDFGNLTSGRQHLGTHSSSTRGIFAGGAQDVNIIEYVEIPTLGDALDFGDLSAGRRNLSGCGSPTRAVFSQGGEFPAAVSNNDFLTISSKGDSTKFLDGDYRSGIRCCSNNVRGLYGGGYVPTKISTIDYLTIASLGNMTDFGDLTRITTEGAFVSSQTRGVYSGGFNDTSPASATNSIEYVTIATTGNAIDFGDSTVSSGQRDGLSDSHGGLGGF
jgi:hypothetical protein